MAPDPLTPHGNRPMVTPIVNAVNCEYLSLPDYGRSFLADVRPATLARS